MKEHDTRHHGIALDYDDAFERTPGRSRRERTSQFDAAGFPDAWSPSTAPSVHQRWLEDQSVFRRSPQPLSEPPESGGALSRTVRPRAAAAPSELGFLVGAAGIGLALAAASWGVLTQLQARDDARAVAQADAAREVPQEVSEPIATRAAPLQRRPGESARYVVGALPVRVAAAPAPAPATAPAPAEPAARAAMEGVVASAPPPSPARPEGGVAAAARSEATAEPAERAEADGSAEQEPPPPEAKELDLGAAKAAIGAAAARAAGCGKAGGPSGTGRVSVTVAPSGAVSSVSVGPPFGGTSVGMCVSAAFRGIKLPSFSGGSVTLTKSFTVVAPAGAADDAEKPTEPPAKTEEAKKDKKPSADDGGEGRAKKRGRSGRYRVNLE